MTTTQALWREAVDSISEEIAQDYPDITPREIAEAVWVKLLTLEAMLLVDPWDHGVPEFIRRESRDSAGGIRKRKMKQSAQYNYRPSDVSRIMETVFDRMDWPSGFTPRDAREGEHDEMAAIEVRLDACCAFRRLPEHLRGYLIQRYYDMEVPEAGSAEDIKLRWTIDRITDRMN